MIPMKYAAWIFSDTYAEPEYMTDAERERLEEAQDEAIDRAVDRYLEDGIW